MTAEREEARGRIGVFVASLVVVALSVFSSMLLAYWRPTCFKLGNAFPATFVYFGLFALSIRYLKRFRDWHAVGFEWYILVAFVIGGAVGAASGSVWWVAGGWQVHSLIQAALLGAGLGVVPILCVIIILTPGVW